MSANIGYLGPTLAFFLTVLTAVGAQTDGNFDNQSDSSVEVTSPEKTTFSCTGRPAGFYADISSDCQIYHTCDEAGRLFSHTCPERTRFQQRTKVCDHWYMVECSDSEVESKAPTKTRTAAAASSTSQGRKSHRHSQRVIATFPYQPGSEPRHRSSSKNSEVLTERFQIGTASNETPRRINKPISTSTASSLRTPQSSPSSVTQSLQTESPQREQSLQSVTQNQTQQLASTPTISEQYQQSLSPPSSQRQSQQSPLPSLQRQSQQSPKRQSPQSSSSPPQQRQQKQSQLFPSQQRQQQKSPLSPSLQGQIPHSSVPPLPTFSRPQPPSLQQQPPIVSSQQLAPSLQQQPSQSSQTQSPSRQSTPQPPSPLLQQFSASSPSSSTARTTYTASPQTSSSTLPPRRYTENIYLVTDSTPLIHNIPSQTTGGFTSSTSTNQGGVISQIRYVTPYREAKIERILVPPRETQTQTTPLPVPDKFTNNPYFESYFKTSFTISSPSSPGPIPTANFTVISEDEEENEENRIEIVIPDTRKMFYIPDSNYDPGDISEGHGTVLVIDLPVKNSMKFQKVPVAEARNHDCPQCHPSFLIPGQCRPCVLIR